MEALFGIKGKDFVLVASDQMVVRSIVVMKQGEEKSRDLTDHCLLLYNGEQGDCVQFSEYVQRNIHFNGIKNDLQMSPSACAHYTRSELASSLRSRSPYQVNVLIAGYDKNDGAQLYWIDYLAAMNKIPFAAHGYASYFCMSLMDRYYKESLTLDEAKEIIKKCFLELKTRFIVNIASYSVKVIDKDGVRDVELTL